MRRGISFTGLRGDNAEVLADLMDAICDEEYDANQETLDKAEGDIAAWLDQATPAEAFAKYLEWNGIIGYDRQFRQALWDLISNSTEYLTTTDAEREEWLHRLIMGDDR